MVSQIFDVDKQLVFYGAYHSNKINILVHLVCVPLLLWSGFVMGCEVPVPFFPSFHHEFNRFLIFDFKGPAVVASLFLAYYFALEPVAALLYAPQLALVVLSATAFSYYQRYPYSKAAIIHGVAWIAQILGHGLAEKRAPTFLDNLLGAVVMAPFFVHIETLFYFGYKPDLHKRVQDGVEAEIARIKSAEKEKNNTAGKKEL